MGVKICIFFLLITIFRDSIHARSLDITKASSIFSTHQDACKNIKPEEIQDAIHQLELADEYEVKAVPELVLLLGSHFDDTIDVFQHLRRTSNVSLTSILSSNPKNKDYLDIAAGSIFQFENEHVLYYVYPGMNQLRSEVFAKYLTYKVTQKAQKIKIALIYIIPEDSIGEDRKKSRAKGFFHDARKFIANVSQYDEILAYVGVEYNFASIDFFVYNFHDNNVGNCISCVELDISEKLIRGSPDFVHVESPTDIREGFFTLVKNFMKSTKMSEKNLDFTYSRNPRFSKIIKCAEDRIKEDLTSDVYTVSQMIHTYYLNLEKSLTEADDMWEKLEGKNIYSQIKQQSLAVESVFNVFVFNMKRTFHLLGIKDEDKILSRIEKRTTQLNFLQVGRNEKVNTSQLFKPTIDIYENNVLKTISFYKELHDLSREAAGKLSTRIRIDIVPKFENLKKNISSEMDNPDVKMKALNIFQRSVIESEKTCSLMKSSDPKIHEEIYKLQLHGDIVKFSNLPNMTNDPCTGETKYIEIFARDTIFIDKDFESLGRTMQFVAHAPKLWVEGKRTVNLTGADGKEHENPSADKGEKGMPGDNGLAGVPGEPGGIFVTVSEEIINENMLSILADGGTGGPGQQGGRGGEALEAGKPDLKNVYNNDAISIVDDIWKKDCEYQVYRNSYGFKGGDGGVGGHGGKAGKISLFQLNKNLTISKTGTQKSPSDGKTGRIGLYGESVQGKVNWGLISGATCPEERIHPITNRHRATIRDHEDLKGPNGTSGVSKLDQKEAIRFECHRNFASTVNDYKKYIRPFLDVNDKSGVIKFYKKIINNEEVNKGYGTFELFEELRALEEQYLKLMEKIDMTFMYENLYKRIEDYSKHLLESEKGQDFRLALGYGYTAALSKANRLQGVGNLRAGFIYDIKDYLDKVSENLFKLKEDVLQFTTNEMGEKYQEDFMKNIREAETIIKTELRREIQKADKSMRKQIVDLFIEVKDKKEKIILKKDALKKAMVQQSIFAVIKSVLMVTTMVYPPGRLATSVLFTATQLGGSFFEKDPKEDHPVTIPASVGEDLRGSYEFVQKSKKKELEELERHRDLLKKQQQKLELGSDDSSEISKKIEELRKDTKALEDEILNFVRKEQEETEESDFARGIGMLSKFGTYLVHNETNYAMTDDLGDQAEKLKQLHADITAVDDELVKIKKMEKQIYDEFEPVMKRMFHDLPSDEKLREKSSMALDVSKWEVQGALKNVKEMIKQFTDGFEVSSEMIKLIEAVEEAMNTIIGIYDKIEGHQREKKLVAYLDRVQNANFEHLHSKNVALEQAVRETRINIRKNVAIMQYERAFKSFKQFVFPFARSFLNESTKPSALELKKFDDFSTFIMSVSQKIDYMKEKLDTRGEIDENVPIELSYTRKSSLRKPFHVWKNETYNDMISNLLDGEEVAVYLDPRKYEQYAVKFKRIGIDLIARDRKDQEKLDEKLKDLIIDMRHMGNSYYTCGSKMYLISHEKILLEQGFDNEANIQTETVKKLAKGFAMASPFATWRIKLSKFGGEMEKGYLAEFKNKVDLFLEGTITFVRIVRTDICNTKTDLSEFYKEYDSILEVPMKNATTV